jgi:hypothetical protein
VALVLNDETVFCSAIGYGASILKVSVPDVDAAVRGVRLRHRVEGSAEQVRLETCELLASLP